LFRTLQAGKVIEPLVESARRDAFHPGVSDPRRLRSPTGAFAGIVGRGSVDYFQQFTATCGWVPARRFR
jgi:hypothetical protein